MKESDKHAAERQRTTWRPWWFREELDAEMEIMGNAVRELVHLWKSIQKAGDVLEWPEWTSVQDHLKRLNGLTEIIASAGPSLAGDLLSRDFFPKTNPGKEDRDFLISVASATEIARSWGDAGDRWEATAGPDIGSMAFAGRGETPTSAVWDLLVKAGESKGLDPFPPLTPVAEE